MKANKILFIAQEIVPFTESSAIADTCKDLLKGAQERGLKKLAKAPFLSKLIDRR